MPAGLKFAPPDSRADDINRVSMAKPVDEMYGNDWLTFQNGVGSAVEEVLGAGSNEISVGKFPAASASYLTWWLRLRDDFVNQRYSIRIFYRVSADADTDAVPMTLAIRSFAVGDGLSTQGRTIVNDVISFQVGSGMLAIDFEAIDENLTKDLAEVYHVRLSRAGPDASPRDFGLVGIHIHWYRPRR